MQTLSTVGYGDIVPTTTWGRVVATFVIVFGVTGISFITAAVTSAFIAAEQESREKEEREHAQREKEELYERLERIEQTLAEIKKLLGR